MNHHPDTTLAFLSALMPPPAGADELPTTLEFRIFRATFGSGYIQAAQQYSKTLAGWYDSPRDLMIDAGRLRGVSGFTTFNPCNPALRGRSYNALQKASHATKDEDIICLRWLYVDIDPVRPADISSTDGELDAAVIRRDTILSDVPGLAESALYGRSGNGAYILARLPDYPNDSEHRQLIANALGILAARYSDATVKVDVTTKNPARVMCLPGTVKCKGSALPDRPWRVVTLDSPPATIRELSTHEPSTFALAAWVAEHAPAGTLPSEAADRPAGSRTSNRTPATANATTGRLEAPAGAGVAVLDPAGRPFAGGVELYVDKIRRASAYLETMAPAISGQGGHDQTFDAACALVKGFDLRTGEAYPILSTWNQRCIPPWSPAELEHKLADADERPDDKPRGYLFAANRADFPAIRPGRGEVIEFGPGGGFELPGVPPGGGRGIPGRPGDGEGEDDDAPCPSGHEDNPHRLARTFIRTSHNHAEGITLRFWQDEFHAWISGAYHPIADKEIRANLAKYAAKEFERIYYNQLFFALGPEGDKSKLPKPIAVTTNLVGHVKQALSGEALLTATSYPDQPCWLDGEVGWAATDILPMRNAVVHLPSYLDGLPCTRKPTPRLFSPYVLAYDWTPDAPQPARWLEFLGATPIAPGSPIKYQVWPDDPESIATLQEWFGLQLVMDTSYQKMIAFIGPPRCGKGTIARVLTAMVGPENCEGPTLSGLGETFGLQPLIGKLSAIIDDARLSGKSDHAVIAERLLSISGQGRLTVRRMYRPAWTGTLPSRITLISNELPRLADNSMALAHRFIVLKFTRSFLGKEDSTLTDLLLAELSGILLWAIEGLRRLRERGKFIQPKSGEEVRQEMEELASPMGSFLAECCSVGPDESEDVEALYLAWKQWCTSNSQDKPGSKALFGRNLRAVLPEIETRQTRSATGRNSSRGRRFYGVSLLPPDFGPPAGEVPAGAESGDSESQTEVDWTNQFGTPF